jgi:hypothetical protein
MLLLFYLQLFFFDKPAHVAVGLQSFASLPFLFGLSFIILVFKPYFKWHAIAMFCKSDKRFVPIIN